MKPPSERDVEMAGEGCEAVSLGELLAQAREEGRLEGIEQAAVEAERYNRGLVANAIRALAKDGGK